MAFKLDFASLHAELDRRAALSPEERAAEGEAESQNRIADEIAEDERRRDELASETITITLDHDAELRHSLHAEPMVRLAGVDAEGVTSTAIYTFPPHMPADERYAAIDAMIAGATLELTGYWDFRSGRNPAGRGWHAYEFLAQRYRIA